jgi:protocatechuate 3,4-dioxygenase beta subunit
VAGIRGSRGRRGSAAPSTVVGFPDPLAQGTCVVRPEQTEGPYFVDERLNRTDVRVDPSNGSVSAGALLRLVFNVQQTDGLTCAPLPGALVDIWQCDADGTYSDVVDGMFDTRGRKYLRGYQVTDAAGRAEFVTIYPGWYPGRTVHIHFKVRTDPDAVRGTEFTSQLYFDDALTDAVFTQPPYSAKGSRSTRNAQDGIYRAGGAQLTLNVQPAVGGDYTATFDLALDVDALVPSPTPGSGEPTETATPAGATETATAGVPTVETTSTLEPPTAEATPTLEPPTAEPDRRIFVPRVQNRGR